MSFAALFNAVLKVLGPVLMGFGTIFQPKTNPTDHWSTLPQVTIHIQMRVDESGNLPRPSDFRSLNLISAA